MSEGVLAASLVKSQAIQALKGKFTARALHKLDFGQPVTITWFGDSVLEGTTVTSGGGVLGTDDAVSLVHSTLAARYPGTTLTKHNRAESGRTVAMEVIAHWAECLADNADIYVLGGGKNDLARYTLTSPTWLQGQTFDSGLAMLEAKVVELMNVRPDACIVIVTDNPYSVAATALNGYQQQWNRGAEQIARAYGCVFVDAFAAFTALGSWDSFLSDGVHPNKNGHALIAATILAEAFPAGWNRAYAERQGASFLRPAAPGEQRLHTPWRHTRSGVVGITTEVGTNYLPKMQLVGAPNGVGAHGFTGSGPWTSSTAGNTAIFTFNGSEAFLNLVMGAGQGVVTIYIDGVPTYVNFDLSTVANGKLLHLTELGLGWHIVAVSVVSGSLTVNRLDFTAGRASYANWDAPSVVASGMGAGTGLGSLPGGTGVASAAAGSLTFTFVGTGVGGNFWRSSVGGGFFFGVITIDGVQVWASSAFFLDGTEIGYGGKPIASGLTYGKHVLVVNYIAAGVYTGGFYVIDDNAPARPGQLQGWAGAAEVVKFGQAFPVVPLMSAKDPSATLTFSSVTATGFTMGATAGWWVANAPDTSPGNRITY